MVEEEKDRYQMISKTLEEKSKTVSAMLSLQPEPEESVKETKRERKKVSKRKGGKIQKNYYVLKDAAILLDAMSVVEERQQGQLMEELIIERFKKVFPTYKNYEKEFIRDKYLSKLSPEMLEELKRAGVF